VTSLNGVKSSRTVAYPSFSHALTLLKLLKLALVSANGPLVGRPTQGKDLGTRVSLFSSRRAAKTRKITAGTVMVGRVTKTCPRSFTIPCILIRAFEDEDTSVVIHVECGKGKIHREDEKRTKVQRCGLVTRSVAK
jgi:hypothetical protein